MCATSGPFRSDLIEFVLPAADSCLMIEAAFVSGR